MKTLKKYRKSRDFLAILGLLIGFFVIEIAAMRISPEGTQRTKAFLRNQKIATKSTDINPFPFTDLPKDMQNEVMVLMVNNEIRSLPEKPESLKIAADKIRELAVSNKALNDIINRPEFTLKLIKNFAKAFHCWDEVIAKALGTRGAQERIQLQNDFLYDAVVGYEQFSPRTFDSFLKKGVDLEWTDSYGATPLMGAIFNNKLAAVKALIKNGADVNQKVELAGYQGPGTKIWCFTALGRVLTKNIISAPGMKIVKIPVNQVLEMIQVLLDAGADPKPACDYQLGLGELEMSSDRPAVIKAIKDAQAKKHVQESK